MDYKLAVVIETGMNFDVVSQGISFYNTVEEVNRRVIASNGLFAFPAEIAEKMLKWREDITKLLPEGTDIINTSYKPIMCVNYDMSKWPVVDGVEVVLCFGSFSTKTNSPFTNSTLSKSFTTCTESGARQKRR